MGIVSHSTTDADPGSVLRREAKEAALWLRRTGNHRMAVQVEALLASHGAQAGTMKRQAADIAVLRLELDVWHNWQQRAAAASAGSGASPPDRGVEGRCDA